MAEPYDVEREADWAGPARRPSSDGHAYRFAGGTWRIVKRWVAGMVVIERVVPSVTGREDKMVYLDGLPHRRTGELRLQLRDALRRERCG